MVSMRRFRKHLMLCLGIGLAIIFAALSTASSGPTFQVRSTVDRIAEILADSEMSAGFKQQKIDSLIRSRIDFRAVAAQLFNTEWDTFTADEQNKIEVTLSHSLTGELANMMVKNQFADELNFEREEIRDDRAAIIATVSQGDESFDVVFKLVETAANEWRLYDLVIGETSFFKEFVHRPGTEAFPHVPPRKS
jgi:ABC-type transporter MlaC component